MSTLLQIRNLGKIPLRNFPAVPGLLKVTWGIKLASGLVWQAQDSLTHTSGALTEIAERLACLGLSQGSLASYRRLLRAPRESL